MGSEEQLEEVCRELEHAAREAGGLAHFADQEEWSLEPRRVPDTRTRWELVDCDGEVWAAGSAKEILRDRGRLVDLVQECATEAHASGD